MLERSLALVAALVVSACSTSPSIKGPSLKPFNSEESVNEFVRKSEIWAEAYDQSRRDCSDDTDVCLEEIVSGSIGPIANDREDGVDEGDIVRRIGDFLVLLRGGRLFTFSLRLNGSRPSATDYIDVAPGEEDIDAWYDEILSYGNTIVVLGFNDDIEASLIRLFEISEDGKLSSGRSFFFRSSLDYGPVNDETRLVGSRLVFYMIRDEIEYGTHMASGLVVNGEPVNEGGAFSAETIYQPIQQSIDPVLHTIAICPLDADEFKCSATSFVGPWARTFYISDDAVYLWLNSSGWAYDYFLMDDPQVRRSAMLWSGANDESEDLAVIYRVPIEGGAPGIVEAKGWPMDKFSFRETPDTLQVLAGDKPWESGTQPAILNVPLGQFGTQISKLPANQYEHLPRLKGYPGTSRFVDSGVLYEDWIEYDGESRGSVWVKRLDSRLPPMQIPILQSVDRIEQVGDIALVIGTDGESSTGITTIDTGSDPQPGQTIWLRHGRQTSNNSRGFSFRLDDPMDVFGLPIIYEPKDAELDYAWLQDPSNVRMTYFGLTPDLEIHTLGEFVGGVAENDDCKVSCNDWYGDARPFFVDARIYALIGYELIEGYLSGMTLQESSRTNGLKLLPLAK